MKYLLFISLLVLVSCKQDKSSNVDYIEVAEDLISENEFSKAKSYADSALKYGQDSSRAFTLKGVAMVKSNKQFEIISKEEKDYSEAIEVLSKAIEFGDENIYAYQFRGRAKERMRDYKGAEKDFKAIISIDNTQAEAYFGLALIYWDLKEYKNVTDVLNKAIKNDGNVGEYYFMRGLVEYRLENFDKSIDDLNEAIALGKEEENYSNYLLYRGKLFLEIDNLNAACIDFISAGENGNNEAYNFIEEHCQ
ncbi:MAG: tetratricopeptide repeat protein [Gracilimonas sp.]